MKRHFKSLVSIFLTLMLIISAVCIATTVTAVEEDTVTYQYMVPCSDPVVAFEGEVSYPENLSVNSITLGTQNDYNDYGDKIVFNVTNYSEPFDFSESAAVITVVFNVDGDYDKSAIETNLTEFISKDLIDSGNVDYIYKNVVNGEVVSSGYVNIDNPSESFTDPVTEPTTEEPVTEPETTAPVTEPETSAPTEPETTEPKPITEYTVIYNYNNGTEDTSVTRSYSTAEEMSAMDIANARIPKITNPYYKYNSVESATFKDDTTVEATLAQTEIKYTVTVNDEPYSSRPYLYVETIKSDKEVGFIVNGEVVAVGTEFKFFVTGDMDIRTDESEATTSEFASIFFNSLSVSEEKVMMELVATAKVDSDYERMGVAFATSEYNEDDVKEAVQQVVSGTARATNGVAVHNSSVGLANPSGQYQFIYAPYLSTSKVNPDLHLYFYAYVVKTDGTVIISNSETVTPYEAIA